MIRWTEPVEPWVPFYTRGKTERAFRSYAGERRQIKLDEPGWYFVDDRGALTGPFMGRIDAELYLTEASREFARS